MSMLVLNKINMPETVYAPGTFTYIRDKRGARDVMFRISNVSWIRMIQGTRKGSRTSGVD